MKINRKIAVSLITLTIVLLPALAEAVTGGLTSPTRPTGVPGGTLLDTITFVINIVLYLVGAIALLMLVYGGFMYIISGGNEDTIEKAKKILTYAIVGVVVVIISYVVVNFLVAEIAWNTVT